jgi:hypothetical protein
METVSECDKLYVLRIIWEMWWGSGTCLCLYGIGIERKGMIERALLTIKGR